MREKEPPMGGACSKGMQVNERVDASGIETQHGGTVAPITIIRTGDSINDNGGAYDGDPNHIWLGEPGDERSEDHDRVMVVAKGRKRPQPAWLYSRSKVNGYIELEWQPIHARPPELGSASETQPGNEPQTISNAPQTSIHPKRD